MSLFDIIYQWFITYIFKVDSGSNFNNVIFKVGANNIDLTFNEWLAYTFTIIILILLVCFLILFVKWIFKLFAGLLTH